MLSTVINAEQFVQCNMEGRNGRTLNFRLNSPLFVLEDIDGRWIDFGIAFQYDKNYNPPIWR